MNVAADNRTSPTTRLLKTTVVFALPESGPTQTVVIGQEDPRIDADAIQAAVDKGGSVLLLGTFDFGVDGRVLLHKDIAISGEADASGRPITTIIGGDSPFFAPPPVDRHTPPRGPLISIEGIHFHRPAGGAIHLVYTGGAFIRGNKVTAIRTRPLSAFLHEAGVLIGPHGALITSPSSQPLVTGSIVVVENEVHLTGPDPTTCSNVRAWVHPTNGADLYVARNLTTRCASNCVDCGRSRAA